MSKHTPGPWFVGMRSGANSNIIYARDGKTEHDDFTVCQVYRMYQHCEIENQKDPIGIANSKLIAAAPDLLEALQDMVESYQYEASSENHSLLKARAAIKKATE